MRVLEVCRGLGLGGAERALIQRLNNAPDDIHSRVLDLRPAISRLAVPNGIASVQAHGRFPGWELTAIHRECARFRPDIVVSRTPRDRIAVSLLRRSGVVPVHVAESHYERSTESGGNVLADAGLWLANRGVDLNIAVSEPVASGPQGSGAKRLVIHHLGGSVDVEAKPALPYVEGLRFLCLGRLTAQKRPDWLIEALLPLYPLFRNTGSRLAIVGDGPLAREVSTRVAALNVGDVVEIVGPVSEPSGVLAASHVLLIASTMEGLPLTVFEAKLMGLGIITTPAGGTREVLGVDDVLLPSFESQDLRAAVADAVSNSRLWRSGKSERAAASAHLDSAVRVAAYYRMLKELLVA